jgi:hypothetical protein
MVSIQLRSDSFTASFSVWLPVITGVTVAPSCASRRHWASDAHVTRPMKISQSKPNLADTVAVAKQCWPAPVSAMSLFLPSPGQQA